MLIVFSIKLGSVRRQQSNQGTRFEAMSDSSMNDYPEQVSAYEARCLTHLANSYGKQVLYENLISFARS